MEISGLAPTPPLPTELKVRPAAPAPETAASPEPGWHADNIKVTAPASGVAQAEIAGLFTNKPVSNAEVGDILKRLQMNTPAEWRRAFDTALSIKNPAVLAAVLERADQQPTLRPPGFEHFQAQARRLLDVSDIPLAYTPAPRSATIARAVQSGLDNAQLSRSETQQLVQKACEDARRLGDPLLLSQLAEKSPNNATQLRREAFEMALRQQNLPALIQTLPQDSKGDIRRVHELAWQRQDLPALRLLAQAAPGQPAILQDAVRLARVRHDGPELKALAELVPASEKSELLQKSLSAAIQTGNGGLMLSLLQTPGTENPERVYKKAVQAAEAAQEPGLMLDLLDWKSRQSNSLPPDADAEKLFRRSVDLARERNPAMLPLLLRHQVATQLEPNGLSYQSEKIFEQAVRSAKDQQDSQQLLSLLSVQEQPLSQGTNYQPGKVFEAAVEAARAQRSPTELLRLAAAQQRENYTDRQTMSAQRLLKEAVDLAGNQPAALAEAAWLAKDLTPAPTGAASAEALLRRLKEQHRPEALIEALPLLESMPDQSTELRKLTRELLQGYGYL